MLVRDYFYGLVLHMWTSLYDTFPGFATLSSPYAKWPGNEEFSCVLERRPQQFSMGLASSWLYVPLLALEADLILDDQSALPVNA